MEILKVIHSTVFNLKNNLLKKCFLNISFRFNKKNHYTCNVIPSQTFLKINKILIFNLLSNY